MRQEWRPWTWVIVLIAILVGLSSSGCQRSSQEADQAPEVRMELAVEPSPPEVGPVRLTITLADNAGRPIEGASLSITGDMAHAGMAPVQAQASVGTGGIYEADLQWTMGGDWIVTILATLPDGRTTSRHFDLTVAGTGSMPAETP